MTEFPIIPKTLNTSSNDFTKEFFEPCLQWAKFYSRAVGYFSSGWIRENAYGMSIFASRGGRARWITSPILSSKDDMEMFLRDDFTPEHSECIRLLLQNVEELTRQLEKNTQNTIGWLIYDGVLEIRFAVPTLKLESGDFHDKFGIFSDGNQHGISFNGSVNDSVKGTVNYESLKVFKSWDGMDDFVRDDEARFERLWSNLDPNVKVFSLPNAVKQNLLKWRDRDRPYVFDERASDKGMWAHQDEAMSKFLDIGHGILEMATGTGKTKTALKIAQHLLEENQIESIVVTVYGTDLLDQWVKEIQRETSLTVYKYYGDHKELNAYLFNPKNSVLVVSRDAEFLHQSLKSIKKVKVHEKSLFIADEVHGLGSAGLVQRLKGFIGPFKYRLGLSATPERSYDKEGNDFIDSEIGQVIFQFGIEEAIKKGILCEFDYYPLDYELSGADKKKIHSYMAAYNAKKTRGELVSPEKLYQDIANVKKQSLEKLPIFESFIRENQHLLARSLIFVATIEYGSKLQEILIRYIPDFHTYFGEDDQENLQRFRRGEINCLLTSKRISEGIDIKSVNSIILFSVDKARIQTIQRIGRSLRRDPTNPDKRATVIDFVRTDEGEKEEWATDRQRRTWLNMLAQIRREIP